MATRVYESHILGHSVGEVWHLIRDLRFGWSSIVGSVNIEGSSPTAEVGNIRKVVYKDGTEQRIKLVELSDAQNSISWEIIESNPEVSYMSAVHTIRLRRVTTNNTTFVEWITDFSSDSTTAVIEDSRFKKREAFNDLEKALAA
eukprot:Colp12_sorted_trinity150504_noHs@6903